MAETSHNQSDPRVSLQLELPDTLPEIINVLEERVINDSQYLDTHPIAHVASVSEQIADLLAHARIKAYAEVLSTLHETQIPK